MRLQVTLILGGKTATGFEVPPEAVESLGSGKRPAVTVTINGYTYRTTIARMGTAYMVPVSAERREAAGIAAGDEIEVDIELDTAPRVVEVPADLAAALADAPGARATFDALSYTSQREHVTAVEGAKADATRQRRIEKIVGTVTPS